MIELHCHPSFLTTPQEEINRVVNGCGPGSWRLDFVPDRLLGNNFKPACDRHDWRYHLGGNELDRLVADIELLTNMLLICGGESGGDLGTADTLVCFEYFNSVRRFGENHFGDK